MQWHDPRLMDEAGRKALVEYGERNPSAQVLLYTPCDGWHLFWLMAEHVEDLAADVSFTHWMPEPPNPLSELGDAVLHEGPAVTTLACGGREVTHGRTTIRLAEQEG